jgi:hypothetical protein
VLASLGQMGAQLYIFTGERILETDIRETFRQSMERWAAFGVPVILASILPSKDGFVSLVNYREYIDYTERLLGFAESWHLSAATGVIADAEPPYSVVDPSGRETLWEWPFRENSRYRRWNGEQYRTAVAGLSDYIQHFPELHPGLSLSVSTIPSVVYDELDQDADLSIAYRFAAYPPQDWDTVNLQIYSSRVGLASAPYYVWHTVKLGQAVLEGAPLSVSVGIIGEGSMRGPSAFQRLVDDIRLCAQLGIKEVVVFTLGRGLEVFGADFVPRLEAEVASAAPLTVRFSPEPLLTTYAAAVWDSVLNVRGSIGLLAAIWCAAAVLSARLVGRAGGRTG